MRFLLPFYLRILIMTIEETSDYSSAKAEADDLRLRGNHEFKQGNYDAALSLYTAGLNALSTDETDCKLRILLLCNRSAVYFQQEEYERSQEDAQTAVDLSTTSSSSSNLSDTALIKKAKYRLTKTLIALQKWSQASDIIQAILSATTAIELEQEKAWKELQSQLQQRQQQTEQTAPETSIKTVSRPISIKEFKFINDTLGHGNFSEIVVVQHKVTQETFALKRIEKKQAADLAKRQHPNVYNEIQMERRVLLERLPPHPYIVQMYHAFQDYNTIYYLMELYPYDLWNQCQWKHDENQNKCMVGCHKFSCCRQWMFQMIDALEHMHRHGIVHRDLKTENVLLNAKRHVVIIDFGTAKDCLKRDLNGPEFVGTPDFMSPEAVNGTSGMEEAERAEAQGAWGANHAADLWALGCMFYIMQTGLTPFNCPSPYLAFLKIKREGCLRRPVGIVEDEAWDLIQQLMRHDPTQRIGASGFVYPSASTPHGKVVEHDVTEGDGRAYNIIRKHPYFAKLTESQATSSGMTGTVLPSLRDLCIRPLAQAIHQDAWRYVALLDEHPPGDGSPRYDCLKLPNEDRRAVMHVLDRCQWLREPRVYARFFADPIEARLNKIRLDTHDVVGLTQMNDDQGKAPKATLHDPYGTLAVSLPQIVVYQLIHPWFVSNDFDTEDECTLKRHAKLLKLAIAFINKSRPHMVVVTSASPLTKKARKLLAKISESIPIVVHDKQSTFVQAWRLGVQCLVLQAAQNFDESSEQIKWIREQAEQCRLSKHPLLAFVNGDPRGLPLTVVKRLARGRTLLLSGLSPNSHISRVQYHANELVSKNCQTGIDGDMDDAISLRSVDSDEEEESRDSFSMQVQSHGRAGVLKISIDTKQHDTWNCDFHAVED
ncbi:hypothetical protein FisN_5Hh005 [Fistulifera solaris]|uniref:non-specific serine/threonine protein kinase n=1 Tax=Fistulifera solaris TaxID=1519565 RepID=A0A1Z5K931_FISSO|nr:hypothetical protein FisN_5Hh005 [Fistulifera solaris]|eukprot:GAX22737.1 hypothetical protein FisN_5Hh005 [Fistulifera solaris]